LSFDERRIAILPSRLSRQAPDSLHPATIEPDEQ
jgi:hypothetical protein